MPDDFLIARNPEGDSSLPYVLRIPLGRNGVVVKARETWPRTSKVYCHRAEWPEDAEIVERVPTAVGLSVARRSIWCSTAAARTAHSSC